MITICKCGRTWVGNRQTPNVDLALVSHAQFLAASEHARRAWDSTVAGHPGVAEEPSQCNAMLTGFCRMPCLVSAHEEHPRGVSLAALSICSLTASASTYMQRLIRESRHRSRSSSCSPRKCCLRLYHFCTASELVCNYCII